MRGHKFKYDVAVSFAGADRAIVEKLVNILAANDIDVFYDSWEQSQLWGKDLYQYLDMIYRQSAKYCIIFISKEYIKKAWTKHELRSAQARAFQQNSEYILPIKLDDTELPGLPSTVSYLDARNISLSEIAQLLIKKLGKTSRLSIKEIKKKIQSTNTDDRSEALSLIAVHHLTEFLDPVINIMVNEMSPELRSRAAWTIDNLNDERAISALVKAIHDNDFSVRSAAGWGLVHLGNKVRSQMLDIMENSNNHGAREMAQLVLSNL
jgi:hypothetical protein